MRDNIADIKGGVKDVPVYDESGKLFHLERKRWANGKIGYFDDPDNNAQYRFIEFVPDENGRLYDPIYPDAGRDEYNYKRRARELPILACGFVSYLIRHWGDGTEKIFSDYLQIRLNKYKAEHKNDTDVFKRDLEREFYAQYRDQEGKWVEQSEGIFEYIPKNEVQEIKEYVKAYFKHIQQFEKQKDMNSATDIQSNDLKPTDTETSIVLNLAIIKIKHTFKNINIMRIFGNLFRKRKI